MEVGGGTQGLKKGRTYSEAADLWVSKHTPKTIVSLVQFMDVKLEDGGRPRIIWLLLMK